MNYADALRFLDSHLNREAVPSIAAGRIDDLSLDPMRKLLSVLGDPQRAYPSVHVTGTNGKGSVVRMVAELLRASGVVTGRYTSPHLQTINERLWWSGDPMVRLDKDGDQVATEGGLLPGIITDEALAAMLTDLAQLEPLSGITPSWFETFTAAAFAWFAEVPVDAAVVEVGLLGRFDATNVIEAPVAVITNIGGDHTDFSEGWREKVAWEKAGIVHESSFLVLGENDPELLPIFTEVAGDRLWRREHDFDVIENSVAIGGRMVSIRTPGGAYDDLFVPAHGAHQGDNAALAIAAVEAFFARPLDEAVVAEAFERVHLPARFEVVGRNPLMVIDGAHNAEAAGSVRETLDDDFAVPGRRIFVVGVLDGRDPRALLEALDVSSADLLVACAPSSPRALPADRLGEIAESFGIAVEVVPSVVHAVARAQAYADAEDVIVITGSFYVAGEARNALGLAPA